MKEPVPQIGLTVLGAAITVVALSTAGLTTWIARDMTQKRDNLDGPGMAAGTVVGLAVAGVAVYSCYRGVKALNR